VTTDPIQIDPLHRVSGPATAWTRVNIAEGIPGVSTPLNWSWWDDGNERMIRGAYHDIGVLSAVETWLGSRGARAEAELIDPVKARLIREFLAALETERGRVGREDPEKAFTGSTPRDSPHRHHVCVFGALELETPVIRNNASIPRGIRRSGRREPTRDRGFTARWPPDFEFICGGNFDGWMGSGNRTAKVRDRVQCSQSPR